MTATVLEVPVLRRRAERLATLVEVTGALAATLELEAILQAATDGVTRLAGFDTAAVYLLDGPMLRLGATTPALPPGFPDELRLAPLSDHPHIGRALDSHSPVLLPDTRTADLTPAERLAAEGRGLRSILYAPMIAGVKPVGVLIVSDTTAPRQLAADDVDVCRTLANLAALAIENGRLFQGGRDYAAALERQAAGARLAETERLELERRLLHAQKLESLGILAGGIAHDFNNLLQAVLGHLDLALQELTPGSQAREAVEQSAQAARRATDLTRQLLAYSGKGRFVVRPVDLNDLVRENAHLFRASVPHTCAVELHVTDQPLLIEADVGQIQQVIMNLITNAADAIGGRPGVIAIRTGHCAGGPDALKGSRVTDVPPAAAYASLEVTDTGCGMDHATLERLFDPFFSTKGVGRGLGMSALIGIVRSHRGGIFVDSTPGHGTMVRVLVPTTHAAATVAKPRAELATAAVHAAPGIGTVLVVDDEDLVRRACQAMVRSLGVKVLAAASGQDAVELVRVRPGEVRLVVLDLSMPGMDGLATLEALLALDPSLKIILCSGFDEQETLGRVAGGRVAGFIQKPYSVADLREALTRAARS